jgi:predicted nucleic acid-binding protein
MKILVDTCVWSLVLRRDGKAAAHTAELQNLILDNLVQMIGPVRQELLSGIRQEAQFQRLEKSLRSFPDLPISSADHVLAAKFYNRCRSKGIQGSNTDFLICALSARHKMPIYTTDRDFTHFAKLLPITLHRPNP